MRGTDPRQVMHDAARRLGLALAGARRPRGPWHPPEGAGVRGVAPRGAWQGTKMLAWPCRAAVPGFCHSCSKSVPGCLHRSAQQGSTGWDIIQSRCWMVTLGPCVAMGRAVQPAAGLLVSAPLAPCVPAAPIPPRPHAPPGLPKLEAQRLLGQHLPLPKGLGSAGTGVGGSTRAGQEQPPTSCMAMGECPARCCGSLRRGTRRRPPLPWLQAQTGLLHRRYLYPRGRQASCAASPARLLREGQGIYKTRCLYSCRRCSGC